MVIWLLAGQKPHPNVWYQAGAVVAFLVLPVMIQWLFLEWGFE